MENEKRFMKTPRWLVAGAVGASLALPFPLAIHPSEPAQAYGTGLLVVASWYLAAAWISYLKRDGLKFLDPKFFQATRAIAEEAEAAARADPGERKRIRARSVAFTKDSGLAGVALFAASLVFQYLLS